LKRVIVWIGAIVIILTMVQPGFLTTEGTRPLTLGLPIWLFYFALLQIAFVFVLWYLCFVQFKDEEE